MNQVTLVAGRQFTGRWGEWHRVDKLVVEGRELEGTIQVRRRYLGRKFGHRIDSLTSWRGKYVMGHDVDWLLLKNGIAN